MGVDITHLTFLDDPLAYQVQADEIYVRIPTDLSTAEAYISFLKENLGLPAYCGNTWDALSDVLRYWEDWRITPPHRVVILHSDLPFLHMSRKGWLDLKNYTEVLLDSIVTLQERNRENTNPSTHRELVAIFPAQAREEILTTLNHPPAWEATIRCLEYYIASELDPTWATVHQYLEYLDGLTAEDCALARRDVGTISVHYNKNTGTYWVEYEAPDQEVWMVAEVEEDSANPSTGISFTLTSAILETFYASGERSENVHWAVLSFSEHEELGNMFKRWYYHNEEEILLEAIGGMACETIRQGLEQAIGSGKQAFSLEYWQNILSQPDVSLLSRLTALCIIGFSTLSEAPTLLRPFLQSQIKQERWVSARFLGLWGDEETLPILLSMLTDELPVAEQRENEYWYEGWRWYAPRLLRKWQTPGVGAQLRNSLAVWLQAESQFDQDVDIWKLYEEKVCYELGYREDLAALADLPLESKHKQKLLSQMQRGYQAKRKHMTHEEEYRYLIYGTEPKR